MPIAEGLAPPLKRLAAQRGSTAARSPLAYSSEARLLMELGAERVRVPTAEGLAIHLQHLAAQRLSLVLLALGLQLCGERRQGAACVIAIRALGLEPCTQKLAAQSLAVLVYALAAAVGCFLLWAGAPPPLEAVPVVVDPLGGAAAGAGLQEWALSSSPQHSRHRAACTASSALHPFTFVTGGTAVRGGFIRGRKFHNVGYCPS